MLGRYSFQPPKLPGGMRPLRDPDAIDISRPIGPSLRMCSGGGPPSTFSMTRKSKSSRTPLS